MEVRRVTICARPVCMSVTVITGHENVRNCSNVSKRCPHDRSCLYDIRYICVCILVSERPAGPV